MPIVKPCLIGTSIAKALRVESCASAVVDGCERARLLETIGFALAVQG